MSVSPSHPPTRLAAHVRACRVGDQMIFLDLLESKYIGVGGPQLAALSEEILGRPAVDDKAEDACDPALVGEWIRRLRNRHLLCDAPFGELARQPPRLVEAVATLTTDDEDGAGASDWRQLASLWRATLVTASWVRRRSLADIANRVAAMKARHRNGAAGIETETLRAAVASYMYLRPFALTTHDRCLNDSLTLIHFLASQGLFPQWVIGVRVHPFGAHSWVQHGDVVLNDLPERVRRYQPILVV